MDDLVKKIEDYTSNLESVVAERTQALAEEQKKIDHVLYLMMPP